MTMTTDTTQPGFQQNLTTISNAVELVAHAAVRATQGTSYDFLNGSEMTLDAVRDTAVVRLAQRLKLNNQPATQQG